MQYATARRYEEVSGVDDERTATSVASAGASGAATRPGQAGASGAATRPGQAGGPNAGIDASDARAFSNGAQLGDVQAQPGNARSGAPAYIESEVDRLVDTYSDLIRRVSYSYLGSTADAEDICQTVLLKLFNLMSSGTRRFTSAEHEKAWIIRTAINASKDVLKSAYRQRTVALSDEAGDQPTGAFPALVEDGPEAAADADTPVMRAVNALPPLYREAIYLYYYEGYSVREISGITGASDATVNARLSRARKALREMLKGDAR